MRKMIVALIGLSLAACSHTPAPQAVASPLDGKTGAAVKACLGMPAQQQGAGTAQVWTFHLHAGSTAPVGNKDMTCLVTVQLNADRVTAVTEEPTDTQGTGCTAILRQCSP